MCQRSPAQSGGPPQRQSLPWRLWSRWFSYKRSQRWRLSCKSRVIAVTVSDGWSLPYYDEWVLSKLAALSEIALFAALSENKLKQMKMRLQGDSLRLRLGQSEIGRLRDYGPVEESVPFGSGAALVCRIQSGWHTETLKADFDGGIVTVHIAAGRAQAWTSRRSRGTRAKRRVEDRY